MTTPNPKSRREVKAMSDEELRIAVAELCGWERARDTVKSAKNPKQRMWVSRRNGLFGHLENLPDYPRDLNAMYEAEKALTGDAANWNESPNQQGEYMRLLMRMTGQQRGDIWHECQFFTLHATAKQRALAFVLTLTESNAQRGEE